MTRRKRAFIGVVATAAIGVGGLALWRKAEERNEFHRRATMVNAINKVAKLTTVEMKVSSFELRKDAKDLLGFIPIKCEKTVAIFFHGTVAAGFDLEDGSQLKVEVRPVVTGGNARPLREALLPQVSRKLHVELPPPRLLYTDAPAPDIVVADGSLCNRIEPSDYQTLSSEARLAVQKEALANGVLAKAAAHAEEMIKALATPLGYEVDVTTRAPLPLSGLAAVGRR